MRTGLRCVVHDRAPGAVRQLTAEAYERPLLDCLRGDATLFSRRDAIDHAWQLNERVG